MRTVEFKLSLNQSQQAQVDNWLNVQRWTWNRGLHLLEEFASFMAWDQGAKAWVACCPVPWQYYKLEVKSQRPEVEEGEDQLSVRSSEGQFNPEPQPPASYLVAFTRLAQTKPYRMSCSISQTYRQPELASPTYFGLLYYFAQKNHEDKPWFCEVPSKFVAGTLKALADAWSEYKAGKRKRPRSKRYKDKIKTLINNNSKSVKISGKQILLPKLGKVTVKTLDKRWDSSVPIATLKIVKEPSGYYLHLTGDPPEKRFKSSNKAVGISLGYRNLLTTDGGKVVEPPAYYQKMEKRLVQLQRKLSRQQNLCPITTYNPELGEHLLSCPIHPHKAANKAKTQQKIARQHEKIRRARKAFNQKLSTKLVREYGGIATAKSELQKITSRPKPIVNKEGTGYDKNGALIKSQFNKLLLTKGLGQLTTLIEQKAAVHRREYIEIAPKNLPDEPRQRAEHYSKRLRLPRAVHLASFHQGRYRAWPWELTLGESPVTPNQEATQVAALREAETTFKSSSESTNPRGLAGVPQATSLPGALEHQQTELLSPTRGKSTHADSQRQSETGPSLTASSKSEVAKGQKKARRHRAVQPTSEHTSGRRKRRSGKENDAN